MVITGVLCGSLWLSACGGGGGDSSAPTPPPPPPPPPAATALPDLDIVAPSTGDLGAAVALSTSVAPAAALKAQWDFGDGTTATDVAPQHQFVRAGDLTVKLTLTNEAGTQKTYSKAISLSNKALVKGNDCSGENDQGGWCWMLPQPTGNRLVDVQFADASTGWRSDEMGEIFKTTDGGKTWTRQPTGVKAEFPELLARSPLDIVAVNRNSSVAAISDDGGKTWQRQTLPALDTPYTFIHALGQGKVLIVPNPTAGLATSTGQYLDRAAGSWQAVSLGKVEQISVSPEGSILTYADGQLTRRASPLAAPATVFTLPALPAPVDYDFIKLQRTNDRVVWVSRVYGGFPRKLVLYRSVDDGQTWQTIAPSIDTTFEASQRLTPTLQVSDASGTKVAMTTATYGPLAETLTDALWNSQDGGKTWTKTLTGGFSTFSETIYCLPSKLSVFCVRGATTPQATKTHLSQDFGVTFTDYAGGAAPAGAAVRVMTPSGYATVIDSRLPPTPIPGGLPYGMGADAPSFGTRQVGHRVWKGALQRTADGGRTWTELGVLLTADGKDTVGLPATKTASQTESSISSVVQVDERTTVLIAGSAVVVSRDGGATWTRPAELNQATISIAKIQFQDANLGWARGNLRSDYTPQLLTTRDAGKTWQTVNFMPNPEFAGVWLGADRQLTLIARDGSVYRSADGGAAWSNPGNASTPLSGFFSDAAGTAFWAVGGGGAVVKSVDKGATWQKAQLATSATLNSVCFADAKYGWAVGNGGEVWATQDGGAGWHRQAVPAKADLYTLTCQDSRTAWIGGQTGLLATGTGGE